MQAADHESQDIEQRIDAMRKSIADFRQRCYKESAYRIANDLIRLAKREQRLIPLLKGQFELVNLAQDLYQHHRARDVACAPGESRTGPPGSGELPGKRVCRNVCLDDGLCLRQSGQTYRGNSRA
jgi:hypothetical protein